MRSSYPDQNIEKKILSYFQNIPEYQSADEWMQRNVRSYTENALKMLEGFFRSFSFTNCDHTVKTDIMENYYSNLCNNFKKYRDAGKEYKLAKTYPLTQDQHIEAIAKLTTNQHVKSFLSAKIVSQTISDSPSTERPGQLSPDGPSSPPASPQPIRVRSDLHNSPSTVRFGQPPPDGPSSPPASHRLARGGPDGYRPTKGGSLTRGSDLLIKLENLKNDCKTLREELEVMVQNFSRRSSGPPSNTFSVRVENSRGNGHYRDYVPGG